jgi:uncharacterized membrane protein
MINLLPPEYRSKMHYGRLDARLQRWLVIGVLVIGAMIIVLIAGWFYINKQVTDLNKSVIATQDLLESKSLVNVRKQSEEISQNIKIINKVLGREIRFSALIQEVGKVMPAGTVLGSLSLSKANGAVDITADTKSYASAAQIAVNLSDPKNNIFAKVDVVSISCSGDNKTYPCTATYKALFGKDTQIRFLNLASGGSQ